VSRSGFLYLGSFYGSFDEIPVSINVGSLLHQSKAGACSTSSAVWKLIAFNSEHLVRHPVLVMRRSVDSRYRDFVPRSE
jgi:hypothetical protein